MSASCATPSRPGPIEAPAAPAPDPRICGATIQPEPAVDGALVAPATEAEREAMRDFLIAEAVARDWGRQGWALAALARAAVCPAGR